MANCLWNDFEGRRKLHLANWKLVCMEKKFGGLGIPNLQDVNLCLLGSWIKRCYESEGNPWRAMIDSKYVQSKPNLFSLGHNTQTSRFWKGIQSIIQTLKFGYRWKVEKGDKVRFWEDTWFGTSPLAVQFWPVYLICNEQNKCISEVSDGNTLKLSFRRIFNDRLMEYWYQLLEIARSVRLTEDSDSLVWQLESKGKYSSSSLYHVINFRGVQPVFVPAVWKIIVPPRVHVFL